MIDIELDQRMRAMEKKIDEIYAVVMGLRRAQIVARNRKILYWVVIIALSVISYYAIQPYLNELKGVYGTSTSSDYADLMKTLNE